MKKIIPVVLILLSFLFASAQKKVSISGIVKEGKNGESLSGAIIIPDGQMQQAVSSNSYGFFSLAVLPGQHEITVQFVGFDKKVLNVLVNQDTVINVSLLDNEVTLKEATVTAKKQNDNVTNATMGMERLSMKEISTIPMLMGERDVLKSLQLLPGVKSAGEGSSGFYVRGGGADQNLILLDEAPVYNASHLLGFFSTFNSDALKDVTLYKGGIPAEFGGRLSSVVDVKMKEGNNQQFGVSGGIGLLTTRLTVEGPIVKNKGSFIASGRVMYAGLYAKLSSNKTVKESNLYFYDANLKLNYELGKKDRIYASAYFGRDAFTFNKRFGISWGNTTATARWNHVFNDKLFSNTSFIYSNFDYKVSIGQDSNQIDIKSAIRDINLKEDLSYFLNNRNVLHFGFNVIYHTFIPGQISASANSVIKSLAIDPHHAFESSIYASNEQSIGKVLKLQYGIRFSDFAAVGPEKTYAFNSDGDVSDSSSYKKGQLIKNYYNFEPRVGLNFIINQSNAIKVSYNRMSQYLHQLSNSTSTNPTDIWIPSSKIVKPEVADQVALGYFGNFLGGKLQPSLEIYYKNMQNQIDYKSGADLILNKYVESQIVFGRGFAYGAEAMIKYDFKKVKGWVAYTWSRSQRKFDDIDQGKLFYAKQDRTHEVSVVAMYDVTKKINLSATWVFYTGNAVTFPSGRYYVDGKIVPLYTSRNGYRMPTYHRLDISATFQLKKKGRLEHDINVSIYNTYNRANAYSINFRQNADDPTKTEAVKLTLFKIVPSISYDFKF